MFSHCNHRLLLICFFSVVSILSAQLPIIHKDIYIDPTTADTTASGDITSPFKTLSSAFTQAQDFISEITESSPTQPLAITFYIKEDTTLSEETSSISLSFDGTNRSPSSIQIAAYGSQTSNPETITRPATVHFAESSSMHIALTVTKVKVTVENINFEFTRETELDKPEFIFIEGKDSEVTFNHCGFKNSKVDLHNADAAVIRLKTGRYLFKNCEFSQLELVNPLIIHEESDNSLIKYELNQFQIITMQGSPLVQVTSALSFDLVSNKFESTTGRLFKVTKVSSTIASDNTFNDATGQYPLYFNSIQKVIAAKNTVAFQQQGYPTHEGFLSITNVNMLGVSDMNVTRYFGWASAISITIEDSYTASSTPMIMLQNINFDQNTLAVYATPENRGLALVNFNLQQKAVISVDNAVFSDNVILDKRENPTTRFEAASTFWINAIDSSLKIKKSTVNNNKADRALSNLYVSVGDLNVASSVFKANTQVEKPESSANYNSDIVFNNFEWYGQDLTFTEDTFQDNYADYGGAISIREAEGLRIPHSVTIEKCVFMRNKAKEGGAIFTNVVSSELEYIQLNENRFEGNEAQVDPDYSASAKIATEIRPHLFVQVLTQTEQKDYKSGEFTLSNAVSGEDTGYSMEFYIANRKGQRLTSNKQYYSSIYMTSSHEGEAYLVKNFTNEVTGPTVEISSFSVVAPFGSLNLVKLLMSNRDDPTEQYTFEFKVAVGVVSTPTVSRDCEEGEIFSEEQQACVKCPAGTYSLSENALSCRPCVKGADCSEGGNKIKALPGFWIDVLESEIFVVYPCTNKERCLGGAENQCAEGYAGPLCEACNTRDIENGLYRPFLRDTCKSCESKDMLEMATDIIGLVVPIAILLYTVRTLISAKNGSVKQFSWCLYCNLFFSYMQNLFILGILDYLPLPYFLSYLVNIIANPSFPVFGYLTCYFPSFITSSNAYVGIISLFASIPLVKMLLVILTAKFVAHRGSVCKSALLGFIWLAFLEAPGFLDFCLRFFDCKQVGNWMYSSFFLDIECDAQNFELLRTIALVPIVLLITIVCPLAIAYSLSRGSLRSDEIDSQKNLRVMVLARSGDHIIKSHRSWIYFYIASFGKLGLLLLSASQASSLVTFSAVVLYLTAMVLLNMDRKIVPFKGWRGSLLFADMLVILISAAFGYALSFLDDGAVKDWLLIALWVGNGAYLFNVNVLDTKEDGEKGKWSQAYGKLQEENVSSSDEEGKEQKKHGSEQLDETM